MARRARRACIAVCIAVCIAACLIAPAVVLAPASAGDGRVAIEVRARLTGWIARRDGFHLYEEGATVRMSVQTTPRLSGETVRARLEWRRRGVPWRLLDRSLTTLGPRGRAVFAVRGLPDGYVFRMRARVSATEEHLAGRSRWRRFRVG